MNIVNPLYVKEKEGQIKSVPLSLSYGNQTILPDFDKTLSKVIVEKPLDLVPENIRSRANIGGVQGGINDYDGSITITQNEVLEVGGKYCPSDIVVNVQNQEIVEKDVNFYDYDGTLLYSYTAAEFANIQEMPENPTHDDLVSNGWNYSLSGAKSYVSNNKKLNVGALYDTPDGSLKYHIRIKRDFGTVMRFDDQATSFDIDWGDGTISYGGVKNHLYQNDGYYTITLSIREGNTALAPKVISSTFLIGVNLGHQIYGLSEECFANADFMTTITFSNVSFYAISSLAFVNCLNLKSIAIPNNIERIGERCFENCKSLDLVIFPESLTSIGQAAFSESGIKKITIPETVHTLSYALFNYCYDLEEITLPNTLTSLSTEAFYDCSKMFSIEIPSHIYDLRQTFYSNTSLRIMTILALNPPTINSPDDVLSDQILKYYVPAGIKDIYLQTAVWSNISASKFVELPA